MKIIPICCFPDVHKLNTASEVLQVMKILNSKIYKIHIKCMSYSQMQFIVLDPPSKRKQ